MNLHLEKRKEREREEKVCLNLETMVDRLNAERGRS